MTVSDLGSIASAIVALLALIVSFITMHKTNKFNEKQNELAATTEKLTQLQIEREIAEGVTSKKADVSANFVSLGNNKSRLKVFNKGKGVAKNVRLVDLDHGNSILVVSDIARKFPVPIMEQHQSVEILASRTLGSGPRVHIKLIWDDDTGTDHEKELTPSN